MRITLHESKDVPDQRVHVIGTSESFATMDEAVAHFADELRRMGKESWQVNRVGYWIDIDVHDPPEETNISLIDADAYEKDNGWSAEEFLKFCVKHGHLLEALALNNPEVKAKADGHGLRTIHHVDVEWLVDWDTIQARIRAHRVMRTLTREEDKAVRLRVWNVLLGVSADPRPVLVCEGLEQPMEARGAGVLIDRDTPWTVPYPLIHLPWKLLRQAVRDGHRVLIGQPLVDES